MTKEELIKRYLDNEEEQKQLREENYSILKDCRELCEHKIGEIAKYTKTNRKNVGTLWHPSWAEVSKEDVYGVLSGISPLIQKEYNKDVGVLYYKYTFRAIKKDGHVSKNNVYMDTDALVWTGEIHEDYKDK